MARRVDLEKEIRKITKTIKRGCTIHMMYEGKSLAQYEYDGEMTIDSKTPLQWLRGCLCFDIDYVGRDASKVSLKVE